jgi:hypothetical protein
MVLQTSMVVVEEEKKDLQVRQERLERVIIIQNTLQVGVVVDALDVVQMSRLTVMVLVDVIVERVDVVALYMFLSVVKLFHMECQAHQVVKVEMVV